MMLGAEIVSYAHGPLVMSKDPAGHLQIPANAHLIIFLKKYQLEKQNRRKISVNPPLRKAIIKSSKIELHTNICF